MRCSSLVSLVVVSFALLSGAEPSLGRYRVHEKRNHVPTGWSLTRRHNASSIIPLRFALKQRNIQDIGSYLYDVSHPNSPNYGKHWTAGDIARMFAPDRETIDTVRSWLIAAGIGEERIAVGRTKGWVQVEATVEEAEQLMNTEYNVYTHISGKEHVACEMYLLPERVQPHVDFVTPSVHFDAKLSRRSGREAVSLARPKPVSGTSPQTAGNVTRAAVGLGNCDKYTTPACLRALYDFFYKPIATDKNSYGVVEYTPQAYLQSDLQLFAQHYSTDLIDKEPQIVSIDGGVIQTTHQNLTYNLESDLDLQYGMSLVTGEQTVTLYQIGDLEERATFNNFLDAIDGSYCTFEGGNDPNSGDSTYPDSQPGGYTGPEACGAVKPAYVISTSYAYDEADVSPSYNERQCAEYAKLGLMGTTILYSSGDHGVAGNGNTCLDSTGTPRKNGHGFNPMFPATCPYVTTVGATMVRSNATVFDREIACTDYVYSGGGFSNQFAMPDYQKDVVDYYLTNYRPNYPSTIWNSTGTSRAYPDISANGANYIVVINGKYEPVYGTSASTPVIGAILSMVNDARLAAGKGPIGFINPTIYSREFASTFNDITEGSNPGCNTTGYNATVGWDPVTGLGTPNFSKLRDLWLTLP